MPNFGTNWQNSKLPLGKKRSAFGESDQRVAGLGGDSTLVVSVPGHHDVALHTPAGCPGVLHQPVILTIVCSVAYDQDSVVQLSLAASPGDETILPFKRLANFTHTLWGFPGLFNRSLFVNEGSTRAPIRTKNTHTSRNRNTVTHITNTSQKQK